MKKIIWKEYIEHKMDGYCLVIPLDNGVPNISQVLYLEGTALEIWYSLHQNEIQETKELLDKKYNAKEEIEKDVDNLILEFQKYKVLEVINE